MTHDLVLKGGLVVTPSGELLGGVAIDGLTFFCCFERFSDATSDGLNSTIHSSLCIGVTRSSRGTCAETLSVGGVAFEKFDSVIPDLPLSTLACPGCSISGAGT